MSQERKQLPLHSRSRWAIGLFWLFGLLAPAWGAAPPETIGETANAPDHMTGRTSEASRASVSARGPRLDPIGESANGPSLARGPRLDPIGEIRFAGNKTTKPQILLQEMLVRVGDPADAALIEQSRQAIMDLGLFKSVRAELLPADERGRVLLITVKEKYYILPIPKLNRNDENDIGYGAQLRFDNLAGLNQRLKITYEIEKADTSSSGEQEVFSVVYSYPRMFGSAYSLEVVGGRTSYPIDVLAADGTTVDASYQQNTNEAGFTVSRWLHLIGPSRGWQLGGGLVWRDRRYQHLLGTPGLYSDGTTVGLTAGMSTPTCTITCTAAAARPSG